MRIICVWNKSLTSCLAHSHMSCRTTLLIPKFCFMQEEQTEFIPCWLYSLLHSHRWLHHLLYKSFLVQHFFTSFLLKIRLYGSAFPSYQIAQRDINKHSISLYIQSHQSIGKMDILVFLVYMNFWNNADLKPYLLREIGTLKSKDWWNYFDD